MPPPKSKQAKGNAAKKEQIAEKVKEIQMRQKNWLRQRDQHLNTAPDPVYNGPAANTYSGTESNRQPGDRGRDSVEHTTQGADILRVHHQPKNPASKQLASQVSDKLNVKVKHGFGSWLQSRKDAEETDNYHHGNGKEHPSAHNANSGQAYGDTSPNSSLHRTSSNNPLSPAEFDWKADSIVARVKQDLGIRNGGGSSGSRHYEGVETAVERSRREKTFVRGGVDRTTVRGDGGGVGGESEMNLSCHLCPVCSNLMNTVAVAPMLLVPCGHTVCRQCSSASTCCGVCGTRTASVTTNIMLQQIITDVHGGRSAGSSASALSSTLGLSADGGSSSWVRGDMSRDHYREAHPVITTKQSDVNYSQQLQNLRERQSTLQEEARSQQRETDRIAAKAKRTENQVKAIAREEECLGQKIQQLQEQQAGLREHREEYSRELQHLQQELSQAQGQVAMVTQCLTSLGHEIDKVQFLAEGQGDSYHHQSQYR